MDYAIKDIRKWLINADTAPALTGIMMRIIYKYTQCQEQVLSDWSFHNERDAMLLDTLVQEQEAIGWENFFKGRISKTWSLIQDKHFTSLDLPDCQAYKTGTWWASNVIRQLIYLSLNTWQIRNVTQRQGAIKLQQ